MDGKAGNLEKGGLEIAITVMGGVCLGSFCMPLQVEGTYLGRVLP